MKKVTEINSMHLNASPEIFVHANKLRLSMTKSEQILWEMLKK